MNKMGGFLLASLIFVSISLLPSLAAAHNVQVFAYVEDGKVYTESYFADGTPVKNGQIKVFNEKNEEILEGKTKEDGTFTFALPQGVNSLRITINAGMGHKSEYILKKDDLQ